MSVKGEPGIAHMVAFVGVPLAAAAAQGINRTLVHARECHFAKPIVTILH